ncbi:ATP-dependent RNA helicase HrpA [Acidothermaceae bacterium B102]|nr:ATP-dependent RNA helicase HrpA [Acidothermaceae bacterium B102]
MDIELRDRLAQLTLWDERRLTRRVEAADRAKDERKLAAVEADLVRAEQRVARRRANVPAVSYPPTLPISQARDEIVAAIRDHQVVIVAGETGSGKTTQIPKMCLELGRGVRGAIGHTQPRRLAARTVAERIAEELKVELGGAVGYRVRFGDHAGEDTAVRLMTDGILLAEIQSDRELWRYDTIIIDEAHERSLNIDYLLAYLKTLLPRRPDLKIIITSATIDPQRFSRHFDDAPVIEVSGRTFPVEVRYRPVVEEVDDEDEGPTRTVRDLTQAILDGVDELSTEGNGDILVFLSGEREIRDTAEALTRHQQGKTFPYEILPLFARLSAADQHKVFQTGGGRRVVLATNVAETSLTVPGIRYVIDTGLARISRYSHRLKVQRLPIEAISQASANQRKGRCGRVADGICIRLYSEEDFLARPEFTEPEILRTSLASVILSMVSLNLGDIATFPFVEPPDRRNIRDGVELLRELGALEPDQPDARRRLTPLGRQLAQLPVDPRLARMVIEAGKNGVAHEVVVIAAALSIQDPRERPVDKQQAADEKHKRFADKDSDFISYLNLWAYLQESQDTLSSNAFRRLCKAEYLHYLRVREWQDLYGQLRRVAQQLDLTLDDDKELSAGRRQLVTASLLAGLLSHIGVQEGGKRDYAGARGSRFALWPGSALFGKPPRWVVAAELVETSRLWGRVAARIEPEWVEPLAQHLVRRNYSEPHWERKRASVVAFEKVTLYGIPLVTSRKIQYGSIDPELSRDLFIRHALVEGDWTTHHKFFAENRALLEEVTELEERTRRRDIVVGDEELYDFYDERLPADVVSGRHFDSWWKGARRATPDLLSFERSMLVSDAAAGVTAEDFPNTWQQGDLTLPLSYVFEPGNPSDGVTVDVPLAVLARVSADGLSWQVPGLRTELATALIKSLPKAVRVNYVPAPDFARSAVAQAIPGNGSLTDALAHELNRLTGLPVPPDSWDWTRVPAHLRMTVRVVDEAGVPVAQGKDVEALQQQLRPKVRAVISQVAHDVERRGLTVWPDGALPRKVERRHGDHVVEGWPALTDDGATVSVRLYDTEEAQGQAMAVGQRRLLLLGIPSPSKALIGRLSNRTKLALNRNPHGSVKSLLDDCVACAVDDIVAGAGGPVWSEEAFAALRDVVRAQVVDVTLDVLRVVEKVLSAAYDLEGRLDTIKRRDLGPTVDDLRLQLAGLVGPDLASRTGRTQLAELPRYLAAMVRRLEQAPLDVERDRERANRVAFVQKEYAQKLSSLKRGTLPPRALLAVRWMIEELRVSLFAQALGTPYRISEERIFRVLDES